jgi:galactofuranosylgalactofuranosylrhamnosyl-N-acetylglucosaminyl-diphospho-decaprenol beta-1,5/1,6-galactofuranosyltransferase
MLRTPDSKDSIPAPETEPSASPAAGPARLVAQRLFFFGPSAVAPEDLYALVQQGIARRERRRVHLEPGTRLSTNTYFGRFHATYWQRWTTVSEVEVSAVVSGTGRLRLLASDTNKVWRIVAACEVTDATEQTVRLVGPVDRFVDGGGMWIEAATETGEMTLSDVRWSVPAPERIAPTSVVICTFNRVEDCLTTLQTLSEDPEALAAVRVVRVVDQGTDPLESRPRFAALADRLGDQLVYLRQPNLGGAGGFTRGLFEATAGESAADEDVLLMDDDVLLEPDILIRLTSFAASTARPAIVGGQMLNLLHPGHLHISAEYADPQRLLAGQPMPDGLHESYLLGVDHEGRPNVLDRRADTEYTGWWSCLIPASIVRAIGYPLPVFFQWDDVEFGYRARAHGFPSISLPGAGVWHADFGWKNWDDWHRYFNLRNALITAALHTPFHLRVVVRQVAGLLGQYLVAMQYGLTHTLLDAVEEFLDGPGTLEDGSVAVAARIRQVRAGYPETVVHPVASLDEDFRDLQVRRASNRPGRPHLTWLKRVAYQVTGRAAHPTGLVTAGDAHWWHVSLFERAAVTDASEQGVRIRRRDRALAAALAKRGARVLNRLRREGPGAAELYRAAMPRLTSRENWARLYRLEDARPDLTTE